MTKKNWYIFSFFALFLAMVYVGIMGVEGYVRKSGDKSESDAKRVSSASYPENGLSGPRIKIDPINFDLGIVVYGEVAQKEFQITNIGDEPLKILRLSTSCGCTKATMSESDKVIEAGKSAPLLVTFDPAVHKDATDVGDIVRVVYILTNDKNSPESEITLSDS